MLMEDSRCSVLGASMDNLEFPYRTAGGRYTKLTIRQYQQQHHLKIFMSRLDAAYESGRKRPRSTYKTAVLAVVTLGD
jgi:hypothetical protein